jgi:hypothetical protein
VQLLQCQYDAGSYKFDIILKLSFEESRFFSISGSCIGIEVFIVFEVEVEGKVGVIFVCMEAVDDKRMRDMARCEVLYRY